MLGRDIPILMLTDSQSLFNVMTTPMRTTEGRLMIYLYIYIYIYMLPGNLIAEGKFGTSDQFAQSSTLRTKWRR
jgi:hypothetical protein